MNGNRPLCFSLIVSLLLLLAGCDVTRHWKEEVALRDGRILVVDRTSTAARFGESGQKIGRINYWSIQLQNPVSLFWEGDLAPFILHLDSQYAYVATRIILTWRECKKYDYPNPPFVYFRVLLGSENWERISASSLPDGLDTNLLLSIWDGSREADKKFFTSQDGKAMDRNGDLAKDHFDKAKRFPSNWCDEVKIEDQKQSGVR